MGATDPAGQPTGVTRPPPVAPVAAGVALAVLVAVEVTRATAPPVAPVDPSTFLDPAALQAALDHRTPLRWVAVAAALLRAGTAIAVVWWVARRRGAGVVAGRLRLLRVGLAAAALWAATDLVRVPLRLWAWRRAVDVGLSTQELAGWARDWLVESVPYWIGVALAVAGAAWVRERWPTAWVPIAGVAGGVVGAVLVVLSPLLFEPLLFDLRPLEPGGLRDGIDELVERTGGGGDADVLVADASRRTTASNAYVSGIAATRRIVLYDTLIDEAPEGEVLAIVAHELGHDLHHDVERAAVSLVAVAVLTAWAVDRVVAGRLTGADGRVSTRGAVTAIGLVVVLAVVFGPVERWSSRRAEAAADAAALALREDPGDYGAMLRGLARRNRSAPAPPPWAVGLFHSPPPIAARIARAASGQAP